MNILSLAVLAYSAVALLVLVITILSIPAFPDLNCDQPFDPENAELIRKNADLTNAHYNSYSGLAHFFADRRAMEEDWADPTGYRSLANILHCCDTLDDGRLHSASPSAYIAYHLQWLEKVKRPEKFGKGYRGAGMEVVKVRVVETGEIAYMSLKTLEELYRQDGSGNYEWKTLRQYGYAELFKDPNDHMDLAEASHNPCADLRYEDDYSKNMILYIMMMFLLTFLGALSYRLEYPKIAAFLMLAPLMTTKIFTENIFGQSIPTGTMSMLVLPMLIFSFILMVSVIRGWSTSPKHTGFKRVIMGIIVLIAGIVIIALLAAESFTQGALYAVPASLLVLGGQLIISGVIVMLRGKEKLARKPSEMGEKGKDNIGGRKG